MSVFIATDFRIYIIDNDYYLATQHYNIIERYFINFGKITLYCRLGDNNQQQKLIKSTDFFDEVILFDRLINTVFDFSTDKLIKKIKKTDLVIGRFHSFSACQCAKIAKKIHKPFMAEVMGDAWDGYWNHGIGGKIVAPYIFIRTKIAIKQADYAIYVTEKYLQNKYPCNGYSIGASNVVVEEFDQAVVKIRNNREISNNKISLMTAANVDVKAKGHEYVIKAVALLKKRGIEANYYIAGGGDASYLKNIAKRYNVEDRVVFLGRLSPLEVFENMDKIDIYVQPSLQEGLPRSVIEAMSRGCPVIGAKTAGIPELIQDKFVVKRRSENDIAKKIIYYLSLSPQKRKKISYRNFIEAQKYSKDKLDNKRIQFYNKIKSEL